MRRTGLLPDVASLFLDFKEMGSGGRDPLRVGVVFDSGRFPAWVDSLLVFLRQIPGLEVQPLALACGTLEAKPSAWLADRVYALSRARFDPFARAANDPTEG